MRKNSQGFTLVEMLIGLALTGITLIAVGTLWFDFAKKFKQIAFKAESRLDTSIAQQVVRKAFEEASPSMLYADLKVKAHCSDYMQPCVRKLEGTRFVNLPNSPFFPDGITHLQFFRDETGNKPESKTIFGDTTYDWRKYTALESSAPQNASWVSSGNLYATFPVILGGDPFFLIKLQSHDFYFESQKSSTFSDNHGEFRLQGTPGVSPSELPAGQLYLIYNPEDSERHYAFRYLARPPGVPTSTDADPKDYTLTFQTENYAPTGWPTAIADQIGKSEFAIQAENAAIRLSTLKEIMQHVDSMEPPQKIYAVPVVLEAYYLEVAKYAMPPGSKINLVRSRYEKAGDPLKPSSAELVLPDIPNELPPTSQNSRVGPGGAVMQGNPGNHRRVYFFRKLPGKTLGLAVEKQ